MVQIEDRKLIGQALSGDEGAFAALYRAHQHRVYGVVAPRAGNRDDAEDLVQMTFVRAFLALESFRGDAAFSTWLTRIALNVCHTHQRTRLLMRARVEVVEDPEAVSRSTGEPTYGEDPEEVVCRKERRDRVTQGIRSLPGQYREAMWLRYVEDQSYQEIMQALGVPMGTVKTWLCRGRQQLRGRFDRAGLWPM